MQHTHGGKRPGAGRKPTGRKPYSFRLTLEEHAKVKEFIAKMKEGIKMTMFTAKGINSGKVITIETSYDDFINFFYLPDEAPEQDADGAYLADDDTINYALVEYPDAVKSADGMVKNLGGKWLTFADTLEYMDDDIREHLHSELAPCGEQEFFTAYEKAHKKQFGESWELSNSNPGW
jgi:hypothetical protein